MTMLFAAAKTTIPNPSFQDAEMVFSNANHECLTWNEQTQAYEPNPNYIEYAQVEYPMTFGRTILHELGLPVPTEADIYPLETFRAKLDAFPGPEELGPDGLDDLMIPLKRFVKNCKIYEATHIVIL